MRGLWHTLNHLLGAPPSAIAQVRRLPGAGQGRGADTLQRPGSVQQLPTHWAAAQASPPGGGGALAAHPTAGRGMSAVRGPAACTAPLHVPKPAQQRTQAMRHAMRGESGGRRRSTQVGLHGATTPPCPSTLPCTTLSPCGLCHKPTEAQKLKLVRAQSAGAADQLLCPACQQVASQVCALVGPPAFGLPSVRGAGGMAGWLHTAKWSCA